MRRVFGFKNAPAPTALRKEKKKSLIIYHVVSGTNKNAKRKKILNISV